MQPYWADDVVIKTMDRVAEQSGLGTPHLFWRNNHLVYGVAYAHRWLVVYSGGLTPPEEREAIENFARAKYGL